MAWTQNFQLELPDPFPVDALERLHQNIADRATTESPYWEGYGGGVNGVMYRQIAAHEAASWVAESLEESLMPPMPERLVQERRLFDFYAAAVSAIDCLYFTVWHVGGMVDPGAFPVTTDRRTVNRRTVSEAFSRTWPIDPLTGVLTAIDGTMELREIVDGRNVLMHRAAPGRHAHDGGPDHGLVHWMDAPLAPSVIRSAAQWQADAVVRLIVELDAFATKIVSSSDSA